MTEPKVGEYWYCTPFKAYSKEVRLAKILAINDEFIAIEDESSYKMAVPKDYMIGKYNPPVKPIKIVKTHWFWKMLGYK